MDTNDVLVAALGAILAVALIVVALRWRSTWSEAPGLPLWRFLRREGITRDDAADAVSAKAVEQAELSCSVCGSRQECRELLSTGAIAAPPAHCPNRRLFREFGLWTGRQRE